MQRARSVVSALLTAGVVVLGLNLEAAVAFPQEYNSIVVIPGEFFSPAAIVIDAGESVTWVNTDTETHALMTVPGAPEAFALQLSSGESATHKFTRAGVYVYYCQNYATYDPQLQRVVAHKDTDAFPIAMEGIVVVKGPGFAGGPSASINISGGAFAPDIVVVQTGATVTWTNADTEQHDVTWAAVGSGWRGKRSVDAPLLNLEVGKGQTATFATPGVYLFYCEHHTAYDARLELAAAVKGTHAFPVSMQGYVIVL